MTTQTASTLPVPGADAPLPRRVRMVLTALTPIAHGDTVTGVDNSTNVRLFMRQGLVVNGIPMRSPALSENAMRSVMVRHPLADHLLHTVGVEKGELPQSVMNLLYSGGQMAAGSKAPADEFELGHEVYRCYPSLDLVGGSVDGFILPRSRLRVTCWLLAREYVDLVARVAPELAATADVSAFDLLTEETRTRGTGSDSQGNQMLYSHEVIAAGAKFFVELTLDAWTPPVTASALAVAIEEWDGFFGGQGRQGRGRMAVDLLTPLDGRLYRDYVAATRNALKAGLIDGTLGTARVLCKP